MPTIIQAIANQLAEDGIVVEIPDEADRSFRIYIRCRPVTVHHTVDGKRLMVGSMPGQKRGFKIIHLEDPNELNDFIENVKKING